MYSIKYGYSFWNVLRLYLTLLYIYWLLLFLKIKFKCALDSSKGQVDNYNVWQNKHFDSPQ